MDARGLEDLSVGAGPDKAGGDGRGRWLEVAVCVVAVGMSAYHFYVGLFGQPLPIVHRSLHLLLALIVLFGVGIPVRGWRGAWAIGWSLTLAGFVLASCLYLIWNARAINERMIYVDPLSDGERILGALLILAILEATRRALGWPLTILALLFLLYARFGYLLPYPFWHRGYSYDRIIEQMYLTVDGIWGIPLAVSAGFVFLFVLFGTLLIQSGTGAFFNDIARAIAGRSVGGPAKTAVVSSALLSMLSGSATANVVTTGSFTIPAMKRSGYKPEFAGGVEAVASTGGLITPPVMGAGAFIMAEFLGVPYATVMQAAVAPAFLYFVAILFMVDLEARRLNLRPIPDEAVPSWIAVLRQRGYLVLPLAVLVYYLVEGYTPATAAVWATVSLLVFASLFERSARRDILGIVWRGSVMAPRLMGTIAVACAIGGMIAGIISLTGLGFRITTIITDLSGGMLWLSLILTLLVAIVLGMGMPTSAVYIIAAAILAPALIRLGVEPIAAHLFIFYGAVMSNITPPLAVTSFAAAAVAGAGPWATSFTAIRIGLSVYIVPFMFVYAPELVGLGTITGTLQVLGTSVIGIFALSVACIGWLVRPLRPFERIVAFGIALSLIVPGTLSDLIGIGTLTGFAALLAYHHLRSRRRRSE